MALHLGINPNHLTSAQNRSYKASVRASQALVRSRQHPDWVPDTIGSSPVGPSTLFPTTPESSPTLSPVVPALKPLVPAGPAVSGLAGWQPGDVRQTGGTNVPIVSTIATAAVGGLINYVGERVFGGPEVDADYIPQGPEQYPGQLRQLPDGRWVKCKRHRRKKLLTMSDKADIAFLRGTLGGGELGRAAITALLSRR